MSKQNGGEVQRAVAPKLRTGLRRLAPVPRGLKVPPLVAPLSRPDLAGRQQLAVPVLKAALRIIRRQRCTIAAALRAAAGGDMAVEYAREAVNRGGGHDEGFQASYYSSRDWDSDKGTLHEERVIVLRKALAWCGVDRSHGGGWRVASAGV